MVLYAQKRLRLSSEPARDDGGSWWCLRNKKNKVHACISFDACRRRCGYKSIDFAVFLWVVVVAGVISYLNLRKECKNYARGQRRRFGPQKSIFGAEPRKEPIPGRRPAAMYLDAGGEWRIERVEKTLTRNERKLLVRIWALGYVTHTASLMRYAEYNNNRTDGLKTECSLLANDQRKRYQI